MVPASTTFPNPGEDGTIRVFPPAATVLTLLITCQGATLGDITIFAGRPVAAGVVVKSIRFWLMTIGVTGPLGTSSKVSHRRSSTTTSPDTRRTPEARTCARQLVQPGQRVLRRQRRAGQRVGVVVIEVGEVDGPVGLGAPAHGHVALADEDQVAPQPSAHDAAVALDRRHDLMVGPELQPPGAHAVGLDHRSGLHELVGVQGDQRLARVEVADGDQPRPLA